jgi:hypothetical protein
MFKRGFSRTNDLAERHPETDSKQKPIPFLESAFALDVN